MMRIWRLKITGFPDIVFASKTTFDYYDTHALRIEGIENIGLCPDCGQLHFLNPITKEQRDERFERLEKLKKDFLVSINTVNFDNAIHHELLVAHSDDETVLPISKKTVVPITYA